VDNSDSVVVDRCDEPEPAEMQNMIPQDSASLAESTTQLDEKLKAETIYYNEMAELARAKRRLIDLQTKKLLLDMNVVDLRESTYPCSSKKRERKEKTRTAPRVKKVGLSF